MQAQGREAHQLFNNRVWGTKLFHRMNYYQEALFVTSYCLSEEQDMVMELIGITVCSFMAHCAENLANVGK